MNRSITNCRLWIVALAAFAVSGRAAAQAPDLHVIIVAYTDDPNIGEGCHRDLKKVEALFKSYTPANRTITTKVFAGKRFDGPNNFNQMEVKNYLKGIPLSEKTGILFYYSGHGDYTTAEGHRVSLPGENKGNFPNESVFSIIEAREQPCRMVAVITDSCSPNVGDLDLLRKIAKAGQQRKMPASMPRMLNAMDDLFFKPGPGANGRPARIDINGAAEHQLAYGPNDVGGFFTIGLMGALSDNGVTYVDDANKDGLLTWHEVFPRMIRLTEAEYNKANERQKAAGMDPLSGPDGKPQPLQTPQAFRLPDPGLKHKFRWSVGVTGEGILATAQDPVGGMRVVRVRPGSPSEGQIQVNDIIRQANGRSVRGFDDFAGIVDFSPTSQLALKVVRNGKVVDITITMKEN